MTDNEINGFIEIHTQDGRKRLVNIHHIIEVAGSVIFTNEFTPYSVKVADFPHFECKESYEEIRDKIARASK